MALLHIYVLYTTIGLLAAVGCIALSSTRLSPKSEPLAYGLLLIPIAGVYLAFVAHLNPDLAWHTELVAVLGFSLLGLFGARFYPLLILGYLGHGAWDLAHEILGAQERLGNLTAIPLAYGALCAAIDWLLAGYFWTRRQAWRHPSDVADRPSTTS